MSTNPHTAEVSLEEMLRHLTEAAEHALAALRLVPTLPPNAFGLSELRVDAPVADPAEPLTDRETTILRLLPTQLSQREIARELFVSVNTVKTHCQRIYRKLGVTCRQAAVDQARGRGLLAPLWLPRTLAS